MKEVVQNLEKVEELRKKFEKSKSVQKYGLKYDDLITLAHPDNEEAIQQLKEKLGVTRQMTHNFYIKWAGPIYPGYETPGKRRKAQTQQKYLKRAKNFEPEFLPERILKICKRALQLKFKVELVMNGSKNLSSTCSIKINGKKCLIKKRVTVYNPTGTNYIVFSLNRSILRSHDFVIIRWENELYRHCTYIVPTSELKKEKQRDSETYSFYIPLHTPCLVQGRVRIDWPLYRNNWDQFRKHRKIEPETNEPQET